MKKHFARAAFVYAALAMVFGVFYREFTKFSGFTGQTTLSVMHPHYLLLGMVLCLVMLMAEQLFSFMPAGKCGKILALYHVGPVSYTHLDVYKRQPFGYFPARGKYLVRPQADETSHKKLIPCGRQGKRAPLPFSVSQRVSPLRRRDVYKRQ